MGYFLGVGAEEISGSPSTVGEGFAIVVGNDLVRLRDDVGVLRTRGVDLRKLHVDFAETDNRSRSEHFRVVTLISEPTSVTF